MISEYDFIEPENSDKAEHTQLDMIEELLKTSTISVEENEMLYKTIDSLNYKEATELIIYLSNKQVNRVIAGLNYNATYLNKFLKETL